MKTVTQNKEITALLERPVRRCAACRKIESAKKLLRFMCIDGEWQIITNRRNYSGRSLYLCPEISCLEKYRQQFSKGQDKATYGKKILQTLEQAKDLEKYRHLSNELTKKN